MRLKFLDINIVPITKTEYINTYYASNRQKNKYIPLPRVFLGKMLSYNAEIQFKTKDNKFEMIKFKNYNALIKFLENHEL